jgi:hypothetical protein
VTTSPNVDPSNRILPAVLAGMERQSEPVLEAFGSPYFHENGEMTNDLERIFARLGLAYPANVATIEPFLSSKHPVVARYAKKALSGR